MKDIIIILILFFLTSCSRKKENYDLSISNSNYNFDLKTGDFEINWYDNYKDKIKLTESDKSRISELIFECNIDTFKREKYVFGKEPLIMPNFNDKFILKKSNKIKSEITISSQVSLEKSKLSNSEKDILNFKTQLFKLLNQNKNFKRNMDTLKVAKKKVPRLFL